MCPALIDRSPIKRLSTQHSPRCCTRRFGRSESDGEHRANFLPCQLNICLHPPNPGCLARPTIPSSFPSGSRPRGTGRVPYGEDVIDSGGSCVGEEIEFTAGAWARTSGIGSAGNRMQHCDHRNDQAVFKVAQVAPGQYAAAPSEHSSFQCVAVRSACARHRTSTARRSGSAPRGTCSGSLGGRGTFIATGGYTATLDSMCCSQVNVPTPNLCGQHEELRGVTSCSLSVCFPLILFVPRCRHG